MAYAEAYSGEYGQVCLQRYKEFTGTSDYSSGFLADAVILPAYAI